LLLLALAVVTMTAASSTVSAMATLSAVTLLSLSALARTASGPTTPTATSAFTAPGTSGGVIRSYIHLALFFVFTRLGEHHSDTRFRSTVRIMWPQSSSFGWENGKAAGFS